MRTGAAPPGTRGAAAVVCALALVAAAGCGSGARPTGAPETLAAVSATTTHAARLPSAGGTALMRRCAVGAVYGGQVHVASGAVALATGYGSVWVSGFDAVSRLTPAGGRVVARVRTPGTGDHSDVAVGDRSVWVTSTTRGVVYRIDPSTDRVIATVQVGAPVQGIAVGMGGVWVTRALPGPGQLIAIDPRENRVTRPPIQVGPGPGQVVDGLHSLWVQNTSPSSVMRVDPAGDRVTTVIGTTSVAPGSPGPGTIAVGYGSLWSLANGSLTRLDSVTGRVRWSVPVPRGIAVVLAGGRVWGLAYPRSRSTSRFDPIKGTAALWEVDPRSGRVSGTPVRLDAKQPIAIAAERHALWIADYASSNVTQIRLVAGRGQGRRACRRDPSSRPSHSSFARRPARSVAFEPRLSRTERKYIGAAWRATVAHDRACYGFHGPELTKGSPSGALSSRFAILRRPATPGDRLRPLLRVSGPTGGPAWTRGAQLYLNQIHRARSAFGATFYVIPAGNVTGQRGVPTRCAPEQTAALERELARLARRQRTRMLAAQARYLGYARDLALRAGGICATFVVTRTGRRALGDNFGCATVATFDRWGVLADSQAHLGGTIAAFWTVVPDDVATVTLRFAVDGTASRHTVTTTVRPVNNVVVAKEPYTAPDESGFPSTIVLRAADGKTIKHIAVTANMPTLCGYGC